MDERERIKFELLQGFVRGENGALVAARIHHEGKDPKLILEVVNSITPEEYTKAKEEYEQIKNPSSSDESILKQDDQYPIPQGSDNISINYPIPKNEVRQRVRKVALDCWARSLPPAETALMMALSGCPDADVAKEIMNSISNEEFTEARGRYLAAKDPEQAKKIQDMIVSLYEQGKGADDMFTEFKANGFDSSLGVVVGRDPATAMRMMMTERGRKEMEK